MGWVTWKEGWIEGFNFFFLHLHLILGAISGACSGRFLFSILHCKGAAVSLNDIDAVTRNPGSSPCLRLFGNIDLPLQQNRGEVPAEGCLISPSSWLNEE